MTSLTATISPEAQALMKRLRVVPTAAIIAALDLQNELTTGHIQLTKLSKKGRDTLGVITNRLRASVRPRKATASGNEFVSGIGSNVAYMGVHEFGFDDTVQVKQFTRRNPLKDRLRVGGELITRRQAQSNPPAQGKYKQVSHGISLVREHSRRMRMPARAPIQTGIRERLPNYGAALSQAIITALKGGPIT